MFNSNMLNLTNALALAAALVATLVLVWELRNGRTIPPIRVERATHPRWYWLCIVTHAVLLAVVALFYVALALAIFFHDFFN
jgi:hypothetical protein